VYGQLIIIQHVGNERGLDWVVRESARDVRHVGDMRRDMRETAVNNV
jgi:hypothetical protein